MGVKHPETHSLQSDEDLVRDVLAGQRDSYALLVQRYERHVHAAAWAILRDHQTAEDVTQETFVKAYRKLNTLRSAVKFSAWLLSIARRTATDLVRTRKPVALVPHLPEMPSLEFASEVDATVVFAALARLPEREQQILLLRYFDDLPVADIAAILSCPIGTVTKSLSRGMSRLRDRLKEKP